METTWLVFLFVRKYLLTYPWSPVLREIAEAVGLSHPSSVVRHLDYLEGWGLITREPHQARSIALTEEGQRFDLKDLAALLENKPGAIQK